MKQVIHTKSLVEEFVKSGIVPDNCKRIVLDIGIDSITMLYFECYGDERLIELDLPKHIGQAIHIKEKGNG